MTTKQIWVQTVWKWAYFKSLFDYAESQKTNSDDWWLLIDKVKDNIHGRFFQTAPRNGAINYFDSARGNGILSVYYQIAGGICRNLEGGAGKCVNNFLCKLNIFMLANSIMKKKINLQRKLMLQ